MKIAIALFAAGTLLGAASGVPGVAAAEGTSFRVKQVHLIIGYGAGGAYDQYGRLVGRFIGRHLPGNPTVVPQNMPAAGSIAAANTIYSVSPRDGSTFALIARDAAMVQLLDSKSGAVFDPLKLTWIGSPTPETGVCVATENAAAKSLDDLLRNQLAVGGTGAGAGNETVPKALNSILGTRFKVVGGYAGAPDVFLAIDRGELDGFCAGYSVFQFIKAKEIASGSLRILFQGGLSPDPTIKAPFLLDLVPDETKRVSLRFVYGTGALGWPFIAPPDLAPEIRAVLRTAFDETMKDPDFLREADRQALGINPTTGNELEAIVREIVTTPPATVEMVKSSYGG